MRIIKKISLLLASALLMGTVLMPSLALAQTANKDDVCTGLALTGAGTCGPEDPNKTGVSKTIKVIINLLSFVVGITSVIMIIIGGMKYVMSQGEGSNTAGAKNTILYAIIGLVVVALAQVIVKFTLGRVTKT